MNISLRQFQAFVTLARLGSFTRAARNLHLSQPALTVQIRQLEDAVGVRLFDRSTRMVEPTPVGRELAPMLERVLQEIDAVLFPAGHPLERRRTITLKNLSASPLILMDLETSVRDIVDRAFESIGEIAVPAFEALYMSTAVALVKAGLGLTRQIGVIRNARRSLSPSAEAFIGVMRTVCMTLSRDLPRRRSSSASARTVRESSSAS